MNKALFTLFFILTNPCYAALSWNPVVLKKVNKQYPGTLKFIRKDLVQVITKKVTTTIKRTDKPTQFLINQRLIDLRNYQTEKDLTLAIQKIVPRSGTNASLWMIRTANADDFLDISIPVIQATITGTTKLEICKTLKEFAFVCTQVANYLSDNMSQAINQSMNDSEAVYKEKFTKWHAHLTILKTNIDQNVVPLLGTRAELIKQCGESLGDVHFQMESCTTGINLSVEASIEQEADLKASALEIKELVKSVYKDSVPMDSTIESLNGISK